MKQLEAGTAWRGLVPAGCERCEVVHLVPAARVGQRCPACARGELEAMPGQLVADPEQVVPFVLSPAELKPKLAAWAGATPFAPSELDAGKLTSRLAAVWWPMWLVDSEVAGHWSAEAGYDYEAKSSRERFSNGKWRSEEVIDVRIRWEERLGTLQRRYDNVPVQALRGHAKLQETIGRTVTELREPFSDVQLSEAMIRLPDVDPGAAWPYAETQLRQAASFEATAAIGAQHCRDFTLYAEHRGLTWTWLLLPMYATWYTDDSGARHAVWVNGQTGTIGGKRVPSMKRALVWSMVLLGTAIAGFLLLALLAVVGILLPPLIIVAMGLAVIPLGIGIAALWPVVRVWGWDRG